MGLTSAILRFDGEIVKPTDTPESLDMDDGDVIDAVEGLNTGVDRHSRKATADVRPPKKQRTSRSRRSQTSFNIIDID